MAATAATIGFQCAERDDFVDRNRGILEMALDDDKHAKFQGFGADLFQDFEGRRCEESCVGWRSEYTLQIQNASWVSLRFSFLGVIRY